MADSTSDYISRLNELIETCKDGERGFRDAAEGVNRADLRETFKEYARQRTQFANELQRHVMRLGGDPETTGSAAGAMHRGWLNLKAAITGKDDEAILNEAERGEDAAVKSYQEVLERDLPSDLRAVMENQYQEILKAHNHVKALRDGASTDDTLRREDPVRNRMV
jgi:uncharacterized protein (TIGR02284 family)